MKASTRKSCISEPHVQTKPVFEEEEEKPTNVKDKLAQEVGYLAEDDVTIHQHDLGDDLAMLAMICCACIRRISSRLVETISSRCRSMGTDVVFVFDFSWRVRGEAVAKLGGGSAMEW